jgi:hypothetical protein
MNVPELSMMQESRETLLLSVESVIMSFLVEVLFNGLEVFPGEAISTMSSLFNAALLRV